MSQILVETSARHIHITEEALETLFGKGHTLTKKKDLSQPGQFACEERVEVIGPKGAFKMSVLGPTRKDNQVEISMSDARVLGVTAPVRESGDVQNTPGALLRGPMGEMEIDHGVIVAQRHIHLTPETAVEHGVSDKEVVKVRLDTPRPLIFDGVVVRVSPNFAPAMHVDTDECNAACAQGLVYGEIIK